MSAYIVDPETIDRIVTYVEDLQLHSERLYLETLKAAEVTAAQATTPDQLGQALYRMNVAAVDHRYNERNPVPLYRYSYRHASPVQVYKSIRCYLYQCTEGDVPEQPLYKALERLAERLAAEIIADLPEYKAAVWA